jgi:hypothetical protein
MSRRVPVRTALLSGLAVLGTVLLATSPGATASANHQRWSIANVGAFGGEPSLASDPHGVLYDVTPSGGMVGYRSTNQGKTWKPTTVADKASGDDCVVTDQTGAVYECNLAGSKSNESAPLQADVWKSTNGGRSWVRGENTTPGVNAKTCGTSCSPFGVDRDWLAASVKKKGDPTSKAEVVLMYHDFYGPTSIWVNISTDGGKTFSKVDNVMATPALSPGAVAGSIEAGGYTFCSTVPAGVGIVPPGKPHAGRIIVGWIASDPAEDAAGCNISQYESFHTFWVSYSDDNGATWTPQLAYDAGVGHDASSPFPAFTLDSAGNPYFGFVTNLDANAAVCGAESTAGAVQSDKSCEYNMYVIWSKDGGATWDGGGGTIPGSAATAYRVNSTQETGTHWFPAIAAAAPGHVDVAYLRTPTILPTGPGGKADPGGCSGDYPPAQVGPCKWELYAAQSSNLTLPPGKATWTTTDLTPNAPMHVGDICNLGIACVDDDLGMKAVGTSRSLLDFIQEAIDPTTGCAHIAYADDNRVNQLRMANQTAGCFGRTRA